MTATVRSFSGIDSGFRVQARNDVGARGETVPLSEATYPLFVIPDSIRNPHSAVRSFPGIDSGFRVQARNDVCADR
ncbi:MAG: hypothetical protein DHS20C11_34330 [Lysobacteraceae bacterium]|nr:MAG: hypothetical protein DHS20C11_34330 [Xanthomonadaceae bacterium]